MTGVIGEFTRASAHSRDIAAQFALADTVDVVGEGTVSLRWTLVMMIAEFARHGGHGDILREQLDAAATAGRTDQ